MCSDISGKSATCTNGMLKSILVLMRAKTINYLGVRYLYHLT